MGEVYRTANWTAGCLWLYGNTTTYGLVDRVGAPVYVRDDHAWGISKDACYQFCGPEKLQQTFSFKLFAPAFTNFLLPWLALTAQLPYETSAWWDGIMSLALAIGSPALITHSLTVTILNRSWVRKQFKHIRTESRRIQPRLSKKIDAAQILLQEGQQMPMRACQTHGRLSSLIALDENCQWWVSVGNDLKNTRRGVTLSLIAQIVGATVAWLFTIITSFVGNLGDIETALQIASGSVWLWMIPVIWGWIAVGTQNKTNSIRKALNDESKRTYRATGQKGVLKEDRRQQGILAQSGLTVEPASDQQTRIPELEDMDGNTLHDDSTNSLLDYVDPTKVPRIFVFDIGGDEARQGPTYNYARLYTWSRFAKIVVHGFKQTLRTMERRQAQCPDTGWDPQHPAEVKLQETTEDELAADCGLPLSNQIFAYPAFNVIPAHVWGHMIVASFIAMFVQWGTTGAAIMISYLTPTAGFGCRSAGYILYGVLATLVWGLLILSAQLSHRAMLLYQQIHQDHPERNLSQNKYGYHQRSLHHNIVCGLALGTQILGKTLAIINAVWIIVANLLEYIGVYATCWCEADVVGLGSSGWVVLLSILVCLMALGFFLLCSWERDNED